jgi:hypothetical protein
MNWLQILIDTLYFRFVKRIGQTLLWFIWLKQLWSKLIDPVSWLCKDQRSKSMTNSVWLILLRFLVMCQLWFEFVHSLNLLLYSYHDNPVRCDDFACDETSITNCLRFVFNWISKQSHSICWDTIMMLLHMISFTRLVTITETEYFYPCIRLNDLNLFLYRYSYNEWKIIWLDWIVSHTICFSIGYETILLLSDYDSENPILW